MIRSTCLRAMLACIAVVAVARSASAQVTAPSTYTTALAVQGEAPGTEFNDWAAASIPVVVMDPVDNPGDVDIANIQIANDNDFIYIHATTHLTSPASLVNLFLGFDTDRSKATGFDVLQVGQIGSEYGYQNDFPFVQYTNIFNLNISSTGGPIGNGGAVIFPFWTPSGPPNGMEFEWKISRQVVANYPPALGGPKQVFAVPSFDFVVYSPDGLGDITQVITYAFASAPASDADFNNNALVDGGDFLIWQRGFGTATGATNATGDADGNGSVDGADLAVWSTKFGGAPALPIVAAVPEPNALVLVGLFAAGGAYCRRRARS